MPDSEEGDHLSFPASLRDDGVGEPVESLARDLYYAQRQVIATWFPHLDVSALVVG